MKERDLKELFEKGKYQEVLEQLTRKAELDKAPLNRQIEQQYYKSRALEALGEFDKALSVAKNARAELSPTVGKLPTFSLLVAELYALMRLGLLDEGLAASKEGEQLIEAFTDVEKEHGKDRVALYYNVKGQIYWQKGTLDTALENFQESLALSEKAGNQMLIAMVLNNIGNIYRNKGRLDTALDYFHRSLTLRKETENPGDIGTSLNNIALIYHDKGLLDTALEYYQQSLAQAEMTGNPLFISVSLNNIGNIYHDKGMLDTALGYLQRSLELLEEIGNTAYVSTLLVGIGEIYRDKSMLDTALNYLQRALLLNEQVGNDLLTSYTLFQLFLLSLNQEHQERARQYQSRLEKLQTDTPEKIIQLRNRVARVLLLKQGERLRDKSQAQDLLAELAREEIIDYELTVLILTHLCELQLEELKHYNGSEVFAEAKDTINKLYTLAQDQKSFSLLVTALLLRMKFALISGDLPRALKYLDQARITAAEKNLGTLIEKVDLEKKKLEEELVKWEELLSQNATLQERLQQARVEDYLIEARKMVRSSK
ncbi:MAG: tetratricopeptide repeat protein [Candidatus Heimdallarchaeota archaeon]